MLWTEFASQWRFCGTGTFAAQAPAKLSGKQAMLAAARLFEKG